MNTIIARYRRPLAAALAVLGAVGAQPAAAQLNIAAEARVTLLARAYNAAGQQLFGQLAARPGNVALSPYAAGAALSILISGARGDTATEMVRTLAVRMAADAIDAANSEVISILNDYDENTRSAPLPGGASAARPGGAAMSQCPGGQRLIGSRCISPGAGGSAQVLAANALMLQHGGDLVSADYAQEMKTKYAAEVFRNAALDDINTWVAGKTGGAVARMLDAADPDAAATVLNAVTFKARWASPFDPALTASAPFDLSRTQKADVPLMNQTGRFTLVSRGGYKAIRLNYEVPDLGLVVVLPDDVEGAGAVARRLGANELGELFAALRDRQAAKPVALTLPRFKLSAQSNLKAALQQAGTRKAFDAGAADFSGMTGTAAGAGRLHISEIVHRVVVAAGEEGTEAAASGGARPAPAAPPAPAPAPFRADHPFLFYLLDDATGVILFQGRVADPRG